MLAALLVPLLLGVNGAPDTVLLDFSTDWCVHCRAMQPALRQLEAAGYPVRTVNADRERALAAQYHVSAFPCFVLIVDGREVERLEGQTDIGNLVAMFQRAGYDPSGRATAAPAAQSGAPPNAAAEMATVDGREATFAQAAAQPAAQPDAPPAAAPAPSAPAAVESSASGGAVGVAPVAAGSDARGRFSLTEAQLLAACVRLKVADQTGNSYGSGTIIDVRNGEALVLTCAHLFRDSDGKGEIHVDLFGPGEPRQVAGRLIGCDLQKDVGLVSIPATPTLRAIHVAPPGYTLHAGDPVATVGCSNGAPPTVQSSHIDSIDRFRGPPNFQVAGQPVQGRSGGGVVSADGYVVGVCNAADPEDNEGLYAALASIYKELDRAKLSFVYCPTASAPDAAAPAATVPSVLPTSALNSTLVPPTAIPPVTLASAVQPSGIELAAAIADVDPPAMPAKMPSAAPPSAISATAAPTAGALPVGLTSDEAATLALIRQQARGAEVICIVRPLSDPHARSEIIVLDKASPAFLKKLADERRNELDDSRQLTSLEVPGNTR